MNEVNENVTVNGAGTQDEEPAAKNNETKAEKFIRLGEYRMNKAIDAIGRLEHLANRSAYEYTAASKYTDRCNCCYRFFHKTFLHIISLSFYLLIYISPDPRLPHRFVRKFACAALKHVFQSLF